MRHSPSQASSLYSHYYLWSDQVPQLANGTKLPATYPSSEHLDLSKCSDTYTKELEKLIDPKTKDKPIVEKPIKKAEGTQDLVAALKASLQQKTKVQTKG